MKDMERGIQKVLAAGAGLLLLLAGACVESDLEEKREPGDLLPVEIPTGVSPLLATAPVDTKSLPDTTRVAAVPDSLPTPTRAGGATYKRAIVLQYNSNGSLLNPGSTDMTDYTVSTSISASLQEAVGCNIYVLVVNDETTTGAADAFATEAKLKEATYDLYNHFPNPTEDQIPLVGSLRNVDVLRMTVNGVESGLVAQGSGSDGAKVELSRIAARFDLELQYSVPGYEVLAESGRIRNVPAKMYLFDQPGETFPAEDAADAFTDISFTLSDCDGDKSDPATKLTRYLPANIRGTNPAVTLPREKYSGTAPKKAIDRCTYVSFVAKEKKDASHKLIYSFYLGGNTTSDFNVRRNYIYSINSTVAQTGEGDLRVSEQGAAPRLETDPMAQAVSATEATLRAVLDTYGTDVTEYGFYYKKDTPFEGATGATKVPAAGLSNNVYTASLTGLTPKTVYYFRAYVTYQGQTVYGSQASFATNAEGAPVLTVVTPPVSADNGKSAISSSNTATGEGIQSQGIVYSTMQDFDYQTDGKRVDGSPAASSPFSVTLDELTKGTVYYYRHYASNAQGYTYTSEGSFRTKNTPSIPTEGKVVSTAVDQLTFSASLPDRGNEVDDYPFEAGVKYWATDPGEDFTAQGGTTLTFDSPSVIGSKSVTWTGMQPGQSYWYTFYSTNKVGTVYSVIQNFTATELLSALDPAVVQIGPQAVEFTVTTAGRNTNAQLTAESAELLSVSGNGTPSKTIRMNAYTTAGGSREATLAFTTVGELPLRGNTLPVTQYGVVFPESFPDVSNIDKDDTNAKTVTVLSNIPWQATSNQSWCVIDGNTVTGSVHTGANDQAGSEVNFTYKLTFNSTGKPRQATITVRGTGAFTDFSKTFIVNQMGDGNVQLRPNDPNSHDQTNKF